MLKRKQKKQLTIKIWMRQHNDRVQSESVTDFIKTDFKTKTEMNDSFFFETITHFFVKKKTIN